MTIGFAGQVSRGGKVDLRVVISTKLVILPIVKVVPLRYLLDDFALIEAFHWATHD